MKLVILAVALLAGSLASAQGHDEHANHRPRPAEPDPHAPHRAAPAERGDTQEQSAHVPPDPPQYVMPQMSHHEMDALMAMNDSQAFATANMERFEWQNGSAGSVLEWDGAVSFGADLNRVELVSEGEYAEGRAQAARLQLLWDHAISPWWSLKVGVRHDFADIDRSWAGIGVHGLAPYWIDVEAMLYLSDEGQTAARVKLGMEWLITQRAVLEPLLELDAYGTDDARGGLNRGLSTAEVGVRLRYEFRREFAPYLGVVWAKEFGTAADHAREAGGDPSEVRFAAGVRFWF